MPNETASPVYPNSNPLTLSRSSTLVTFKYLTLTLLSILFSFGLSTLSIAAVSSAVRPPQRLLLLSPSCPKLRNRGTSTTTTSPSLSPPEHRRFIFWVWGFSDLFNIEAEVSSVYKTGGSSLTNKNFVNFCGFGWSADSTPSPWVLHSTRTLRVQYGRFWE